MAGSGQSHHSRNAETPAPAPGKQKTRSRGSFLGEPQTIQRSRIGKVVITIQPIQAHGGPTRGNSRNSHPTIKYPQTIPKFATLDGCSLPETAAPRTPSRIFRSVLRFRSRRPELTFGDRALGTSSQSNSIDFLLLGSPKGQIGPNFWLTVPIWRPTLSSALRPTPAPGIRPSRDRSVGRRGPRLSNRI
jgi:hypothetical protein